MPLGVILKWAFQVQYFIVKFDLFYLESRADLEAKTNGREEVNTGVEEVRDQGEEDTEVLEGTLVAWEGLPNEPLFKKKTAKPGRFYIVNCGEAKGSSLNSSSSLPSTASTKPVEAPATSATCSCCASGCHGVITGETSKRVSRRRPKGPKKVQLVTKEEHHKILNSYIEDKKYEPGKVKALFSVDHQTWTGWFAMLLLSASVFYSFINFAPALWSLVLCTAYVLQCFFPYK